MLNLQAALEFKDKSEKLFMDKKSSCEQKSTHFFQEKLFRPAGTSVEWESFIF